jgi:phage shock protein A
MTDPAFDAAIAELKRDVERLSEEVAALRVAIERMEVAIEALRTGISPELKALIESKEYKGL